MVSFPAHSSVTQSDIERERYEARRKAQLDHNTYLREQREARERELEEARDQARLEGEIIGKIDMIHLCEQLLKLPPTPTEQLTALTLDDLTRLADELQARLLKPR